MAKELPPVQLEPGQTIVVRASSGNRVNVSRNGEKTRARVTDTGTWVEPPPPPPPPPPTGGWETRPAFMARPASNVLRFTSNAALEAAFPGKVISGRSFANQVGNDVVSIRIENCSGFKVMDCDFDTVTEPIFLYKCVDFELGWLRAKNIVGPSQRNGTHRGNLVQMDDCHRYDVHHFKVKGGDTEDVVSQFKSGGDTTRMSKVRDFALDMTGWKSSSGTGVIIGDAGGGHTEVFNGTMLNPGNVGQQIIDGPNIKVHDLVIYSDSNHPSFPGDTGITTYGGNPQVEIWNVKVKWFKAGSTSQNPYWWGAGTVNEHDNDWHANIDPASLAVVL